MTHPVNNRHECTRRLIKIKLRNSCTIKLKDHLLLRNSRSYTLLSGIAAQHADDGYIPHVEISVASLPVWNDIIY